ncbi:MAG: PEGA domain-containing protein [Planctomycetota bacterium]|nr:PEGA domain-containing protein [Planctomycetota bacterium]
MRTLLLSTALCGGCATLVRGTHQDMKFDSVPRGAIVEVAGKTYTTPSEIDLCRRDTYPVTISKPGYRTVKFDVTPQWDGISLVGNMILPGGSIGLVYDSSNGAARSFYKLARVVLVPATQPSEPPLVLNDFKGHLLTDDEFASAVQSDRRDRSQFFRGEP